MRPERGWPCVTDSPVRASPKGATVGGAWSHPGQTCRRAHSTRMGATPVRSGGLAPAYPVRCPFSCVRGAPPEHEQLAYLDASIRQTPGVPCPPCSRDLPTLLPPALAARRPLAVRGHAARGGYQFSRSTRIAVSLLNCESPRS